MSGAIVKDQPSPYSIWRHSTTGNLFVVLGVASDPVGLQRVVYLGVGGGRMFTREIDDFLSGTFQRIH